MKINKHLANLLFTEDTVVLPNFGVFRATYMPAKYDKAENAFLPPFRTLGFSYNPEAAVFDSMLVQSYLEHSDLSYPEALNEVEAEICSIKEELLANGTFVFNGLGTLYKKNDIYDFIPVSSGLFTPDFFAMPLLSIKTIETLEIEKNTDPKGVNAVLKPSFQPTDGKKQSIFVKPNDKPIVITIQRATLRKCLAAAAIACIAALAIIPMKYQAGPFHKLQQASIEPVMPVAQMVSNTLCDKPTADASLAPSTSLPHKGIGNEGEENRNDQPLSCPSRTKSTSEQPYFTIVLAAGITLEGAEYYANELRKEGINAVVTDNEKPMVTFGNFDTKEAAHAEIKKHTDNKKFHVAWVKEIKGRF